MASGWAYVGCADFATGSGPTGSVQFHSHGTSINGSQHFMFHTASVYHGAANTLVLSGNMVITGSLSASVIKYENISVIDATGSTFFGNTNDDVHARTGSLRASTLSTPVFWATASANGAIPYVGIGTIGALATLQVQGGSATSVPTLLIDHDDDDVVGVDINLANTTEIGIDIDASNTTAAVLDITANALTTGPALNISTTATNNSAGALVKIAQSGDRAGDAASIGLDIDFDTGAAANARAFRIDSEQTTGIVAEINGDILTSGTGVDLSADALTSGKGIGVTSTSNGLIGANLLYANASGTSTDAYSVAKIVKDAANLSDSNAIVGLDIDFDGTDGTAGRAFRIDSEQTTGVVAEINGDALTTGTGVDLSADALTSGKGIGVTSTSNGLIGANLLYANASGTSTDAYSVAKIVKDAANLSDSNAIVGLDIDFDGTDGTAGRALRIDSEQTTGIVAEIDGNALTAGVALDVSTSALTDGKAVYIGDNSANATTRNSVEIVQAHASATGATALTVQSDGGNTGMFLDKNASGVAAQDATGLYIDFVRTVAASGSAAHNDIGIHLDVTSRSRGTSTVVGHDVTVTGHTDGTSTATGMELTTTGADTNNGLIINCADGGTDFKAVSSVDTGDFFSITTTTHGATTLATVDDDSNDDADLTLDADGKIVVEAKAGDEAVFNEGGLDVDFRVESVDETHMIFVEGSSNRVSIGDSTDAPAATLEIANASDGGVPLLILDSNDTDKMALHIDAANIDADVIDIVADAVTTANVIDVTADGLTTGKILNLVSDSSNTDANTLALIHNDNASAVATTVLHVLNDAIAGSNTAVIETTAAETNPLLELKNSNPATDKPVILSLNRSDATAEADDMSIGTIRFDGVGDGGQATSYVSLDAIASDVTATDEGGKLTFNVFAGGTAGTAGATNLLSIGGEDVTNGTACEVVVNDAGIDCDFRVETANMSNALFVDAGTEAVQIGASSGAPGGVLEINQYVNGHGPSGLPALLVTAADVDQIAVDIDASQTTANVIDVAATALTTGKALFIDAGNATTTSTTAGPIVHVDFDKTGIVASGQTSTFIGLDLDMDDAATNVGTSTMTGMDLDVISALSGGTVSNIGLDVSVAGADTNYAALFRSGSVGIGTGAPSKKLHVSGSVSDASILVASDAAAIELYPASGPALRFGTPGTTYSHQIYGTYSSKHQIQLVSSLDFQISGALGGVGYYFEQSTGNVGIGTQAPGASLHVSSSGDAALLQVDGATNGTVLFVTGSGRVGIGTVTPATTLDILGDTLGDQLRLGHGGVNYYKMGRNSAGFLEFRGNQTNFVGYEFKNSLGRTALYVSSSLTPGDDRIGIGTATPTAQLAVNGALHVTGSILPGADNSHDLGSSAMRWANVYTGDLHLANERGDWTVVEEEDYLTIKNNKTGKRFKLLMEEIED